MLMLNLVVGLFVCFRVWYSNGDYLVLLVTLIIILPLSLLKNLGECL